MYYVGLVGFIASAVGFGLGGFLALFFKRLQEKASTVNALCTGLILGLVCLEIAPESIYLGGWLVFVVGFLIGILSFFKIHELSHKVTPSTNNQQKDRFLQTGILLVISVTIHNFPLGIAFGSSQSLEISKHILQTLILHNIPEGIAMFIPLFLAGLRFNKFLLIIILVSLPVGFGSITGSLIGMNYPLIWAFIISFALGIIIVVTIKEIFLEAVKHSSITFSIMVAMLGVVIIWGYLTYI